MKGATDYFTSSTELQILDKPGIWLAEEVREVLLENTVFRDFCVVGYFGSEDSAQAWRRRGRNLRIGDDIVSSRRVTPVEIIDE